MRHRLRVIAAGPTRVRWLMALLGGVGFVLLGCVNPDAHKPALTAAEIQSAKTNLPSAASATAAPNNGASLTYQGDWNNFPDYLQSFVEGMQTRWETLAKNSRHRPTFRSTVAVTFRLNSAGQVDRIVSVTGTADELAGSWCVAAIRPTETFSYGAWTDEMIRKLGHAQELTFNFIYK